jgi:hypothetical protein
MTGTARRGTERTGINRDSQSLWRDYYNGAVAPGHNRHERRFLVESLLCVLLLGRDEGKLDDGAMQFVSRSDLDLE